MRLVDQEGQITEVSRPFDEGKGQVEEDQAAQQAGDVGVDRLVGGNDGLHAAEGRGVHRIAEEEVDRHTRTTAMATAPTRDRKIAAFLRVLLTLVDQARHAGETPRPSAKLQTSPMPQRWSRGRWPTAHS